MTLVLDAGAFLAIERGNRDLVAMIKAERQAGRVPLTHGGIIGQVWRGGRGRQVAVARLLPGVEVQAIDEALGRRAGVLLARAGGRDVIDAALVAVATDGDTILTSDPASLVALAQAADLHVDVARI